MNTAENQAIIDSFRVVVIPPVEYRFEKGRIVTQHGWIGFPDRDMTEIEALMFLNQLHEKG